jgi:excisionase family DNA binding protein
MDKMIDELVERIKALPLERQAALFTWLEKAENEELTASDAARVLGVDRQTLIRRIERGELKARKDGRFWRIKRRDIEPKEEG